MTYSAVPIHGDIGYGTMSLTWKPVPQPMEDSLKALEHVTKHAAVDVTFINGGEFYGGPLWTYENSLLNMELLEKFIKNNSPEENRRLVICVKGGVDVGTLVPDCLKEGIAKSVENVVSYFPKDPSLRPQLIFEAARVDKNVPLIDTVGYIAEYVKKGVIDGVGLSEVSAASISAAADVFPISAVELEMSLMTQDVFENGTLAELSRRKIPLVAYSPIGRGFLTDSTAENPDAFIKGIDPGDLRKLFERFSPENYPKNVEMIKKLYAFAHDKKGVSLEVLALSWLVGLSGRTFNGIENITKIIPIPSGSSPEKIDRNIKQTVELSDEDYAEIKRITDINAVHGHRYTQELDSLLWG